MPSSPVTGPVVVLGGGSLGSAILSGLAAAGLDGLRTTTRTAASAHRYDGTGIDATSVEDDPDANRAAVRDAAVVVVGVKPAGTAEMLRAIGDALPADAVVVTLAVGTPIAALEPALPEGAALVRAMPNTPVRVNRGVTGLARGSAVADERFAEVRSLFGLLGEVVVVPEERIDAVAAVAGSGPAYVYLLLERFAAAAVGLGFEREDAERMVAATFGGAVAMGDATGEAPAVLRRGVTSPGGTTAAAVAVFDERDLGGLIADALDGAMRRAAELAAR
ncbi:pyrroline-5-carboxylate reductase [Amnibacterium endophyticum]|uniref:Pyrroline-5-carboxylate reductase n=1 Tax=Amnibacterium endophyticum TaxID=2109337 RepID=A0ABW4LKU1_9MICO